MQIEGLVTCHYQRTLLKLALKHSLAACSQPEGFLLGKQRMRKLRLRKMKRLVQSHSTQKANI